MDIGVDVGLWQVVEERLVEVVRLLLVLDADGVEE